MSEHNCHLTEGFTLREKILVRISFAGLWLTGFIAIWPESIYWALGFMILVLYGVLGLMARYWVCPRCPHLHKYNDCLQMPPALMKRFVKKPTSTPMNKREKFLTVALFVLIPLFPQYWLIQKPLHFAVFWVFCGAWYLVLLMYFCKHCRVSSCPFNRTGINA